MRFILYEKHTQSTLETYFDSIDIQVEGAMEAENIEGIKSLVSAGIGTCIVPHCIG
jgi:DNA-binding transcriptional LysR family regulator